LAIVFRTNGKITCYVFWSDPVKHTAADRAWPIIDIDSVSCTLEDRAVLRSLWNPTKAPPWQFRTAARTHMYLLTYCM